MRKLGLNKDQWLARQDNPPLIQVAFNQQNYLPIPVDLEQNNIVDLQEPILPVVD